MKQDRDWYDAVVIANDILGESFTIGEMCAFRKLGNKQFEIFNIKDTIVVMNGVQAKSQLRSCRDRNNAVIRSKDQGFINWKYESVKEA